MRRRRHQRSRGAALVEFGIVAPLLFLLLFGVIEFGWAFVQYLDVRHGAREGARLAAVNYGTSDGDAQATEIIVETCDRMDTAEGATVTINYVADDIGSEAHVRVATPLNTLTGIFDSFLGGVTLESDVDIRLEQDATWNARTQTCT